MILDEIKEIPVWLHALSGYGETETIAPALFICLASCLHVRNGIVSAIILETHSTWPATVLLKAS